MTTQKTMTALDALAGLKLLVVDDDFVSRMALERILQNMGFQASAVDSAEQALEALAREPWDGVLMDVQLSGMDGLEATRRIRNGEVGEAHRNLPIIAVTAHALNGERDHIMNNGVTAYLSKPFFVEDLRAVLVQAFPHKV